MCLHRFIESKRQSSQSTDVYANVYNWINTVATSDGHNWFLQPVRNQYYQYDPRTNDTTKPLLNWDNGNVQVRAKWAIIVDCENQTLFQAYGCF